jgi:hypothetical protein
MRLWLLLLVIAGVALVAAPATARLLYLDGPPPGHTGGFGEQSCADCHFDNPVNDGEGAVEISGLPERYEPGETYRITVTVRRPGMALGGFQAAIRFAEGDAEGEQAGSLAPTDDRTSVRELRGVGYISQTVVDAGMEDGAVRWEFDWTAPSPGGPGRVAMHAAGNAADGDDSAFGDYVYLAEVFSRIRK